MRSSTSASPPTRRLIPTCLRASYATRERRVEDLDARSPAAAATSAQVSGPTHVLMRRSGRAGRRASRPRHRGTPGGTSSSDGTINDHDVGCRGSVPQRRGRPGATGRNSSTSSRSRSNTVVGGPSRRGARRSAAPSHRGRPPQREGPISSSFGMGRARGTARTPRLRRVAAPHAGLRSGHGIGYGTISKSPSSFPRRSYHLSNARGRRARQRGLLPHRARRATVDGPGAPRATRGGRRKGSAREGPRYVRRTLGLAVVLLGSDPDMHGRVLALHGLAFLGTTPLGGPLRGWICEAFARARGRRRWSERAGRHGRPGPPPGAAPPGGSTRSGPAPMV